MAEVIVIAGTADARKVIAELAKLNIDMLATVTTSFGSGLLGECSGIDIREGKLTSTAMVELIKNMGAKCLVDASHPYACEVSMNAIEACKQTGIPYLRFEREETKFEGMNIIKVGNFEEAAASAASFDGNIFLTVGSNNLETFTQNIPDFENRLFVRVLPDSGVVAKCERAGLTARNIIAIKGPFTKQMNIEMLKYCSANVLVTKDGGKEGGTQEKLSAAEEIGIPVILVERPEVAYTNQVSSINEVITFVEKCILTGGE